MSDPTSSAAAGWSYRPAPESPPAPPRRSRLLLVGLPVLAVFVAFGAVVWLAHEDGPRGSPIGEPPLIRAAATPIKLPPNDPGGREIANQGEVRELLSDAPTTEPIERLLPLPEEPLNPETAIGGAGSEQPPGEQSATANGSAGGNQGGAGAPETSPLSSEPATAAAEPGVRQPPTASTLAAPDGAKAAEAEQALDALIAEVSQQPDASGASAQQAAVPPLVPPSPPRPESPSATAQATPSPQAPEPPVVVATPTPAPPAPAPAATAGRQQGQQVAALPPRAASPAPGTRPLAPPPVVTEAPRPSEMAALDQGYRIQLAAVREEADARRAWDLFQVDLGPILNGLRPYFERAQTANGVFYRVQVGPFANAQAAESLCDDLKQHNASCFVVRR